MEKEAPKKSSVLAPSSPVHWDVKNITRTNHCFVTNHVLEIGEPLVVRIVKVHLRGSRERKKKSVDHQIFIIKGYVKVTLVVYKDALKNKRLKIYIQQKTQHMLKIQSLSEDDVERPHSILRGKASSASGLLRSEAKHHSL